MASSTILMHQEAKPAFPTRAFCLCSSRADSTASCRASGRAISFPRQAASNTSSSITHCADASFRAPVRERWRPMSFKAFEPRYMKLSVLTAALQELTPRERRDSDPDVAVEEWLAFARDLQCPYIQLSAALHPSVSDVPAEAMLDPVANTLDLRKPFDKSRAARVTAAMLQTGVGLSDLAFFDNMLAADRAARQVKHDFMLRVFDAAALLGADAVWGFVGRNPQLEMDENLVMFEEVFVPLLREAKARGLTYRVEQCPMPGWTT